MNVKTYMQTLTPAQKVVFAKKVGTSLRYIQHIAASRKKPELQMLINLIRASDGELTLPAMRPDLFPKNKSGRDNMHQLTRAVEAVAPECRP